MVVNGNCGIGRQRWGGAGPSARGFLRASGGLSITSSARRRHAGAEHAAEPAVEQSFRVVQEQRVEKAACRHGEHEPQREAAVDRGRDAARGAPVADQRRRSPEKPKRASSAAISRYSLWRWPGLTRPVALHPLAVCEGEAAGANAGDRALLNHAPGLGVELEPPADRVSAGRSGCRWEYSVMPRFDPSRKDVEPRNAPPIRSASATTPIPTLFHPVRSKRRRSAGARPPDTLCVPAP